MKSNADVCDFIGKRLAAGEEMQPLRLLLLALCRSRGDRAGDRGIAGRLHCRGSEEGSLMSQSQNVTFAQD